MFVTIINDCHDANVIGRQLTRSAVLFGVPATFVAVNQYKEIEAAGNLIDVLDTSEGKKGVILVNVAPRHGKAKKWPNGTPFAYFTVGETLIVSTIDGHALSLVKKLGITDAVNLLDIPIVMHHLADKNIVTEQLRDHVIHTQFRSLEFAPRVAHWLLQDIKLPSSEYSLEDVEHLSHSIWFVDNFGNCKTTMLPEDIGFAAGKKVKTTIGDSLEVTCYSRLKDVPNNEPALIIGSSGYKDKRFLEFVIQGKSAAKEFALTPGSVIL